MVSLLTFAALVPSATGAEEPEARAAWWQRLVMPGDMGEHFKVMALTRATELPRIGFSGRDLRHLL